MMKINWSVIILTIILVIIIGCAQHQDVVKTIDTYTDVNTVIMASAKTTKDFCEIGAISKEKCDSIALVYNNYVTLDNVFNEAMTDYLLALKKFKETDENLLAGAVKKEAEDILLKALADMNDAQKHRLTLQVELIKLFIEIGTWEGGY